MIIKLKKDIWYDNEKLLIIKGQENLNEYENHYKEYSEIEFEDDSCYLPNIIFLSSTICNLKCKYCYADAGTYNLTEKMRKFTADSYKKCYEKLKNKFGGINAISFFGGEPLLNFSEIRKFVEYLNDLPGPVPEMSINTNLTLLTSEMEEFVHKYKINIGTSIDGPKEINDYYRVGNSIPSVYELTANNLKKLSELSALKVVQFTVSKKHIENYKKGAADIWLKEIENLPINTYEVIPVESDDPNIMIDLSDIATLNNYKEFCYDLSTYFIGKLCSKERMKIPRAFVGTITRIMKRVYQDDCGAGKAVTVTPEEDVYPCHMFAGNAECKVNIDSIQDRKGFIEESFFLKARDANRKHIKACKTCISKNVCGIWCKGFSYMYYKDFLHISNCRCLMEQIMTERIVVFLANEYPEYEEIVINNILDYHKEQQEGDIY